MRIDRRVVLRYRAAFGAGFIALGCVVLWRILMQPAPAANKGLGVVLALAMIGLGVARVATYVKARREGLG
jgi:hypothetical protein